MSNPTDIGFGAPDLLDFLERSSDADLDGLDFGVIGIDAESVVRRYNAFESKAAGLSPQRVLGNPLFTVVAPCMNNYLVAQRLEDAREGGTALDDTIDYVLTLRMRPVKVRLRLLAGSTSGARYVLVHRSV
jgi:photoactive yellow protein